MLSKGAANIAASQIVFGSALSGLSLAHISNCSAAKRSRAGIAGAIKLVSLMRGKWKLAASLRGLWGHQCYLLKVGDMPARPPPPLAPPARPRAAPSPPPP